MSRIYRSTDKKLPKELRDIFNEVSKQKHVRAAHVSTKAFDPEDEMIIEGIANLAKPDRWNEVIVPAAWNLKNFKKNPVMLYQHRQDELVGKALTIDVKDDGLYFTAQIGNPKLAPLTARQIEVRSLLAQGILKTNSVGFYPHVWEWDDDEEVLRYTDVELLEISIVAIPMQQDSIITSVKSWRKNMDTTTAPTPAAQPLETTATDPVVKADDKEEGDKEPTMTDVHKLVKECHEMLTKATSKSAEDASTLKTLTADVAALKTSNAALVKENGDLKTKSAALLAKLVEKGLLPKA